MSAWPTRPAIPSNAYGMRRSQRPSPVLSSRMSWTQCVTAALAAGVPDLAAELAQLSLEHTTDDARRAARLDRLADARFRAGDSAGAVACADRSDGGNRAGRGAGPSAHQARRDRRRGDRLGGRRAASFRWRSRRRREDPLILAEALLTLAAVTDDIALAEASSQRALELLEAQDEPDPVILSGALDQVAGARFRAGRGLDHDMFARAIAIERAHPVPAALRSRRHQLRGAAEVRR